MVEFMSGTAPVRQPGFTGDNEAMGVTIQDLGQFSLLQVAAWPDQLNAVAKQVAKFSGLGPAPRPGQIASIEQTRVLRIEPLKWWILTPSEPSPMFELDEKQGTLLDLSHARTWIHLSGDKADVLLNHFLPLDLREHAFQVGTVASTAMHHIGVSLWREGDGYHLVVPRSFAASLWEMLIDSGVQYGIEVP